MRVLIVDDNEFIRKSMESFLSKVGFGVRTADSGHEALSVLGEYDAPIDIVITDVMMPGKDGFDVVDEINNHRLIGRRIGLVAMSGGGRTIDAKTALDALDGHVDAYLRKPFKQKDLQKVLQTVIKKNSLNTKPAQKKQPESYWEI